jgi:hypothetical protein
MASVLEGVAQRIRLAPSWDRLQEEVACAEKIIATENHEWWVLLSFRGLVLPA